MVAETPVPEFKMLIGVDICTGVVLLPTVKVATILSLSRLQLALFTLKVTVKSVAEV